MSDTPPPPAPDTGSAAPPASISDPAPSAPTPRRWDWRRGATWFGAEFLVVVTGVLVALAVNAWWGNAQQRADERETLHALREEFTSAREKILAYRSLHERVLVSVAAVSDSLNAALADRRGEATVPDTALALSLMQGTTSVQLGTLQGLIVSGRLGIVSDPELQAALGAWGASLTEVTEEEAAARRLVYEELDRALRTRTATTGLWETAGRMVSGGGTNSPEGRPVSLPVDTDLAGLFELREAFLAYMISEFPDLLGDVDLILARIDASLGDARGDARADAPRAR